MSRTTSIWQYALCTVNWIIKENHSIPGGMEKLSRYRHMQWKVAPYSATSLDQYEVLTQSLGTSHGAFSLIAVNHACLHEWAVISDQSVTFYSNTKWKTFALFNVDTHTHTHSLWKFCNPCSIIIWLYFHLQTSSTVKNMQTCPLFHILYMEHLVVTHQKLTRLHL